MTTFLAVLAVLLGTAGPVSAAPAEDDSKKLRDALAAASQGHVEAKNKLDNSKKRQAELEAVRKQTEAALGELRGQVGIVAANSYKQGRVSGVGMLLNASSSDDFLNKITGLDMLAQLDARKLARYTAVLAKANDEKVQIDREVNEQIKLENQMARRVKDAEKALAAIGGGKSSRGFVDANSPAAQPAPRNPDGSWPKERCIVDDPTPASGCITPRTLHALQQARNAGFKRYASCHRSGGGGEHPLGRACDFAAASGGFENKNATGGDKAYGDRLAAYYVQNASRLGVMYVIWYREIWMPGKGWSSYSGRGSPAATHTNHVHLSML